MKEDCWICQRWKYFVVFYTHSLSDKHYTKIDDPEKIAKVKELYKLGHGEQVTLTENSSQPMIMGSIS